MGRLCFWAPLLLAELTLLRGYREVLSPSEDASAHLPTSWSCQDHSKGVCRAEGGKDKDTAFILPRLCLSHEKEDGAGWWGEPGYAGPVRK